jgi:hypothetical protein
VTIIDTKQTIASANVERVLPFAGPALALVAMLVVASTTTVVTVAMMMAG